MRTKISDNINMPIAALFAVGVTFYSPTLAVFAWIIFIVAGIIKVLNI
jgi:hypothetical protein